MCVVFALHLKGPYTYYVRFAFNCHCTAKLLNNNELNHILWPQRRSIDRCIRHALKVTTAHLLEGRLILSLMGGIKGNHNSGGVPARLGHIGA
eukprot:2061425-Amphidinium_carterae.1